MSSFLIIISDTIQRDDITDAELQEVAAAVQRAGKLKELADALEVVPLLKALEVEKKQILHLHCCNIGIGG